MHVCAVNISILGAYILTLSNIICFRNDPHTQNHLFVHTYIDYSVRFAIQTIFRHVLICAFVFCDILINCMLMNRVDVIYFFSHRSMLLHAHSIVSTVISCIASKSNSNQNKDFKICVSVKNVSIHVEVI